MVQKASGRLLCDDIAGKKKIIHSTLYVARRFIEAPLIGLHVSHTLDPVAADYICVTHFFLSRVL